MSGGNPSAMASAAFTNTGSGKTYYVAKTGSDNNSCSQAQSQLTPKLTIAAGVRCLAAGDSLQIRSGTYDERLSEYYVTYPRGTSATNPITIMGAPSEIVNYIPLIELECVNYSTYKYRLLFLKSLKTSLSMELMLHKARAELKLKRVRAT